MKEISFRTDVLPLKNELFRMALRITLNRDDAEDVVQETMMKVWNRREQWEQIESMEAFCMTWTTKKGWRTRTCRWKMKTA